MAASLPLLRGSITLADALRKDDNILLELSYPEKRLNFYLGLYQRRSVIEALVAHHLRLPPQACKTAEVKEWIHGSFNVCIPVDIILVGRHRSLAKRVIIRIPLPYKLGESCHPGNAEEKLRCEIATYAWIQQNCPTVPIPRLWGFGFPGGHSFTALENAPFLARLQWYFRRMISWMFGSPFSSPYVSHKPCHLLENNGYMIVDYVDEGEMLSTSWETHRHDPARRANLFRDLSRIMLAIAQIPLPRIASWTIDNHGILSLTNRPLTLMHHQLENEGIPTGIGRNLTYPATEPYYLDLLACHDSVIRHKPNAIHDKEDGEAQLSALTMMKAMLPHYTSRDFRHGPFVLALTDLHQSNIFVDQDWNITKLIDLEWACALPIETLHPPYWLTSQGIDTLEGKELQEYTGVRKEFIDIFEREEKGSAAKVNPTTFTSITAATTTPSLTRAMNRGWEIGNFWYFSALNSPKGLYNLFFDKIQPHFVDCSGGDKAFTEFEEVVAPYWSAGAAKLIDIKIKEKEAYSEKLRALFMKDREGSAEDTDETACQRDEKLRT